MNQFDKKSKHFPATLSSIIEITFGIWMTLVLINAIQHPHFIISNVSNRLIAILGLSVILILLAQQKSLKSLLLKIVRSRWFLIFSIIVVIFYQVALVTKVSTPIGFDPGWLYAMLTTPKASSYYLSINPNNLFMLFFESGFLKITGLSLSWLHLNILSTLCVDFSVIINCLIINKIDHKKTRSIAYLQLLWLLIFPMIIIPYTDTMVLPFVSFILLCYVSLKKTQSFKGKMVWAVMLGFFGAATYLMKPSSTIPLIAITIIELLQFSSKTNFKRVLVIIALFTFTFVGINTAAKLFTNHQTTFQFKRGQSEPPVHFIAMGLTNGGGYYQPDVDKSLKLKNTKKINEYSYKLIKTRLSNYGTFGYLKFLLLKNNNNTSNGSFGWGEEGHFIDAKPQNSWQNFFFPSGTHVNDFYWLAQLFWIVIIAILVIGFNVHSNTLLVLRLSILGGLLFLLIFEGGRSRYLVQFLPMFFLISSLTLTDVKQRISGFKATLLSQSTHD